MNINGLSFKGYVGNEMYIARNDADSISKLAEKNQKNSAVAGLREACEDIFENLTMSVLDFREAKALDAADVEEAQITKDFMEKLIAKNKETPFLPEHILRSCQRLIKNIDLKFQQLKKTLENL